MKKTIIIPLILFFAAAFSGCAGEGETIRISDPSFAPVDINEAQSLAKTDEYDIDLTRLNATMLYSQVYNMVSAPEDYVGKKVKMEGTFNVYQDPETGKSYFACLIADATACCSQGIEFELKEEHSFPDDYPAENAPITVSGIFDTYYEDECLYCRLKDAELL